MRHLDLFSGIGGFALASSWVWGDEYENVGHSEVEPYACKVYHSHFKSECLGDITKIEWKEGQADLITGGFPCQPHSVAGKRKASEDERDLWGECVRAVREVRPRYALFENVPGLLTSERGRFFNRVLSDLAKIGYDVQWTIISAYDVGAPHRRERVWIVCYPQYSGWDAPQVTRSVGPRGDNGEAGEIEAGEFERSGCRESVAHPPQAKRERSGRTRTGREGLADGGDVADPTSSGLETEWSAGELGSRYADFTPTPNGGEWWATEPNVGRVANGIPSRVDRLKGLGNAIVPQCAEVILRRLKENGL